MKKLFTPLIITLFFLSACAKEEIPVVIPDPVVKVTQLNQVPTYQIDEIGTLKSGQEVELVAQSAGTISDATVKIGDKVTVNQILASIGADKPNSAARIGLENVQLQLNNAQQNLNLNKANNLDGVTKAQLRVQSLNTTLDRLNRNLNELTAQNATTQTSLELQRNTIAQNAELSTVNASNLQSLLDQSSINTAENSKNTLDGVFVNLSSNLAKINSILNPEDLNQVHVSDLPDGLGEQDYSQLLTAVDAYNTDRWNLENAQSNYENNLPLSEDNVEYVIQEARQNVDELRQLLAETRETLNASTPSETFPSQILEAYKGAIGGAEAMTLGDLMKLDTISQSVAASRIDETGKMASSETNQVTVNNQLSEADNALQKFYITSNAAVNDLMAQIQQTQLDLQGAQNDLVSASRTAGLLNSSKDLELATLSNQVRLAQSSLEDNKIISKMDGVISQWTAENGTYVTPGMRVGTISQTQQVKVVFYLKPENAAKVALGQNFVFNTSENTTNQLKAVITKIAPTADLTNKKIEVEGVVENQNLALKAGTFVNIHLDLSDQTFEANKIYVPMTAIIFGQNEKYVYVVENQMAVKKVVEVGDIFGAWVEVLSGLTASDLLIIEGQRNLPPEGGVKVNYGQRLNSLPQGRTKKYSASEAATTSPSVQQETLTETQTPTTPLYPEAENQSVDLDTLLQTTPIDSVHTQNGETLNEDTLYPIPENSENLGTK